MAPGRSAARLQTLHRVSLVRSLRVLGWAPGAARQRAWCWTVLNFNVVSFVMMPWIPINCSDSKESIDPSWYRLCRAGLFVSNSW